MNKLLLTSAIAAISFVSQSYAMEQERWPRWYVGLSGGVTFLGKDDISGAATGKLDYNTGGLGNLALGYMPPATMQPFSNMRFEVEGGYHYNSLDSATIGGAPVATSGHTQIVSYMGNAYYDFRNTSGFTPYFGGGAGGARVYLSKNSGLGNTDSSANVFAWQLMAGISYAPVSMPQTEWLLGYRYFVADSPEFSSAGGKIKLDDQQSHNVELGGRFKF